MPAYADVFSPSRVASLTSFATGECGTTQPPLSKETSLVDAYAGALNESNQVLSGLQYFIAEIACRMVCQVFCTKAVTVKGPTPPGFQSTWLLIQLVGNPTGFWKSLNKSISPIVLFGEWQGSEPKAKSGQADEEVDLMYVCMYVIIVRILL